MRFFTRGLPDNVEASLDTHPNQMGIYTNSSPLVSGHADRWLRAGANFPLSVGRLFDDPTVSFNGVMPNCSFRSWVDLRTGAPAARGDI